MHKFFTPKENFIENKAKILGDDVKHLYKVLRLNEGDKIVLNNCDGEEFTGIISTITKQEVIIEIIEKLQINNESNVKIYLFQGLPKAQKMDLIVQKGTELGITEFIPTLTDRVDIKLKGDFKKLDRLNRIALEAAKQSKRSLIPNVVDPISFDDAINKMKSLDIVIVPYENAENFGIKTLFSNTDIDKSKIKTVGILVGPEGGFELNEINKLQENGAYIVTLGSRILRTETAGFVATSLVQYELGDLGGN
ncbi:MULTISPECIES: RsmE family RNA methyltransferase [Clostridium]|uniref:Ribosomal RNA small subunit methyltransferase E n=1 Tax=Clostridium sartagoforme AAU1 TaxID=1202534 RepID=R9CAZ2_9CLOT|nr:MULTISPECIES: RsmE family RNA methyltransferase [Clostridium]EOR26185.1 16S ribosomal RNA methyltransferase RsmE [Clostridium sartagoforme AAU1]KLE16800.1 16S rRNA methyltransferase [Clostridium sp. C8]